MPAKLFEITTATILLTCATAGAADPASIEKRIAGRTFPSVFQAWNPVEGTGDEDALTSCARHDLVFGGAGFFTLRWDHRHAGLATSFRDGCVKKGLEKRAALLKRNPNMILLAEIRYRDAHRRFLPDGHRWWRRDKHGAIVKGWAEGGFLQLDFSNPAYRAHVATRAAAAVKTGVVDGVMLDWWRDDRDRLALVAAVRTAVGPRALILANPNARTTPKTAGYLNGYFMECTRTQTPRDWKRISNTLLWAEKHLRAPRINCLETWFHASRRDTHLMRATTTLSLTHANGYCLFSDPNPLPKPDHLHDWYPFWDKSLGRPAGTGVRSGAHWRREFEKGTVIYNPPGAKPLRITFQKPRKSRATGKTARTHTVPPGDGDLLLVP